MRPTECSRPKLRGRRRHPQHDRVGAVGHGGHQDAVAGLARRQGTPVSIRPACAAPVCPTVSAKRIGDFRRVELQRAHDLVDRARVGRIENHTCASAAGATLGLFQHRLDDLAEQRPVRLGERETLFPEWPKRSSGIAPGIEELARHRSARLDFSDHVVAIADARTPPPHRRRPARDLPSGAPSRQSDIDGKRAVAPALDGVGRLQQRRKPGAHRSG